MGTAASLPYDEATMRKLRGVVTMRYYGAEREPAVPMRDGVEMVFECATEEQVVEVPQTVLPMVYGRGHEGHGFHNRPPPLSDPSELEGDQEFQRREKSLEASIQAQYRLEDGEKDVIGYISDMPGIHPLHVDRRARARLLKSDGNLARALERTKAGVEEQKRREQEELKKNKNKKKEVQPVPEPSWDKIEADEGTAEAEPAAAGKAEPEQGHKAGPKAAKGQGNAGKAKNPSKETQPPATQAGVKASSVQAEEKVDFGAIAASKAQKKHERFALEERERQVRRREELTEQRTQERLLHIINDF